MKQVCDAIGHSGTAVIDSPASDIWAKSFGSLGIGPDEMYYTGYGSLPTQDSRKDGHLKTITEAKEFQYAIARGMQHPAMKALSPGDGSAVTSTSFPWVPIYVDPIVVDISRKQTPLVEMFARVTNYGLTADYNIISAKGDAFTAGLDASFPEANSTVTRNSQDIKFLYSVGRVLGQSQASFPPYTLQGFETTGAQNPFTSVAAPNAMQLEVQLRVGALKELEENLLINGDASSDETQFNGFATQMSTTNQLDKSGAAFDFDWIDETIEQAVVDGGLPKIAVCSYKTLRIVRQSIITYMRWQPQKSNESLPFGVSKKLVTDTMVGEVYWIPSRFITDGSDDSTIYFLDTDVLEVRVLQDTTYERLGKFNDSEKFFLKQYQCLVLRAPTFCSSIKGIKNT